MDTELIQSGPRWLARRRRRRYEGRLGAADAALVVARVTGLITGAYLHG